VAVNPQKDVGIVFYDRIRGNLHQSQKIAGKWTTVLLDGQTPGDPGSDTGDTGIGASLAIDAKGDWHIAYVDGIKESLKYMKVIGGTMPQSPEIIDDGKKPDGTQNADGSHVVGDDSSITVSSTGEIRVAYMDATGGKLRIATRAAAGGWTRKEVAQAGLFAGYFSQQITAGGKPLIGNWWRTGGAKTAGDVSFVSPLSPVSKRLPRGVHAPRGRGSHAAASRRLISRTAGPWACSRSWATMRKSSSFEMTPDSIMARM
jgi:hypothetical protein